VELVWGAPVPLPADGSGFDVYDCSLLVRRCVNEALCIFIAPLVLQLVQVQ
jgi:hypothetical protein